MLTLRRPSDADIAHFLERQAGSTFSYPDVGATRTGPPRAYNVDHNRIKLGERALVFDVAVSAIRRWEMFNIGWVTLCWPRTPIETGQTVGILVPLFGLWSLNACRIVYQTIDSDDEITRVGFAYGTLADHMESGEERFSVEWRRDDDTVWYDLFAFSRPRHPLAKFGGPLSRALQRRFARDSLQAMIRATRR
jgi:uncharacterized protein (UPF0548 family)